jgi:hypothetical protein
MKISLKTLFKVLAAICAFTALFQRPIREYIGQDWSKLGKGFVSSANWFCYLFYKDEWVKWSNLPFVEQLDGGFREGQFVGAAIQIIIGATVGSLILIRLIDKYDFE